MSSHHLAMGSAEKELLSDGRMWCQVTGVRSGPTSAGVELPRPFTSATHHWAEFWDSSRPPSPVWVESIRDQCLRAEVAFFFKQWGGKRKDLTGRVLQGRTWDEMPLGPVTRRAAS
ncbi:MAG: DUF5131 family protein [Chthonomonas sp.]|nr:DUF5131 family protein [Chthonomonas sp.]